VTQISVIQCIFVNTKKSWQRIDVNVLGDH